jgi:hypothetical protein
VNSDYPVEERPGAYLVDGDAGLDRVDVQQQEPVVEQNVRILLMVGAEEVSGRKFRD